MPEGASVLLLLILHSTSKQATDTRIQLHIYDKYFKSCQRSLFLGFCCYLTRALQIFALRQSQVFTLEEEMVVLCNCNVTSRF